MNLSKSCIVATKINWYGFSVLVRSLQSNQNGTMQNSSQQSLDRDAAKSKFNVTVNQNEVKSIDFPTKRKMCLSIFSRCLIIAFALLAPLSEVYSQSQSNAINEICNNYNGRRIYLELGEHGVLQSSSVVVPSTTNVNKNSLSYQLVINLVKKWNRRPTARGAACDNGRNKRIMPFDTSNLYKPLL